ncbi:MAG TPA: cytochrome C oxidase subunit IV family protein [Polyangiaceae bacterium]
MTSHAESLSTSHRHESELVPPSEQHGSDETGYAHVVSIRLLVGVFAALVALTVVTVAVTQYDIGPTGNLVVALLVATLKAGLVVTFFMHLLWDRRFHLLLFLTAVLTMLLFLGTSSNDRTEYQPSIDTFEQAQAAKNAK